MMETILIPQYKEMKSGIALCVDRFDGYTQSLSEILRNTAEYKVSPKIEERLKKITKDNDIHNNGLYRFLSSTALQFFRYTMEHENKDKELKTKHMNITPSDKTLDKNIKTELKAKIDKIETLKNSHISTVKALITKQKDMWKLSKNGKNPMMEDKAKVKYLKAIETEETIRIEIKKISDDIHTKLTTIITERLQDSFDTLTWLIAECVSNERSELFLTHLHNIDVHAITEEIISSFCKSYRYAVPSEYFSYLDFDATLLKAPDITELNPLTVLMDFEEDKDLNLYMQERYAKKKTGIRKLFSFKSKASKKYELKKTNLSDNKEEIEEKKYTKMFYYC